MPAEQSSPTPQPSSQPPQWSGLFWVSTQRLPHWVVPPPQLRLQVPKEQTSGEVQALSQAPQLVGSQSVSTQTPLHRVAPGQTSPPPVPLVEPPVPLVEVVPALPPSPDELLVFESVSSQAVVPVTPATRPMMAKAPKDRSDEWLCLKESMCLSVWLRPAMRPSLVVADNTLQCPLGRMITGCVSNVAHLQGLIEVNPVGEAWERAGAR
jgi:hypothetical protein